MHNTDLGFFIFSFCYVAVFEECIGMIRMNLEELWKMLITCLYLSTFHGN